MVVKGKFSAAAAAPVNALNSKDLPTLGKPTIPTSINIPFLLQNFPIKTCT
jgi:hypothetical protein